MITVAADATAILLINNKAFFFCLFFAVDVVLNTNMQTVKERYWKSSYEYTQKQHETKTITTTTSTTTKTKTITTKDLKRKKQRSKR